MAEALLPVVLEKLNALMQNKIGLLLGVNKEMEKLSSVLSTIRAVLEDAELKQLQDKAIQNWLRKIKQAAYDVDDILDECATEAIRLESKGRISGMLNKVHASSLLTCINPFDTILFRYKIGIKMKEVGEKLDAIAEERMKFHLHEMILPRRVENIAEWRQTSSILTQPQVFGREEDKEYIVEKLVKHASDCQDVSVYPIIGMGGLGKTTLAQMVFNDKRVTEHFELRIWVCVSDHMFDVKRVIKAIIESMSGNTCEELDLDPLQRRLQHNLNLNGKRFLLVLDDVWNEDEEKWDKLKGTLTCGSRGASIIITTRVEKVASIMGTITAHHLSRLSDDDCWSLFKQPAFWHEREESPNLVAIGKEIVKKCGGVPLAAKALGSLMRFKSEENEWLFVKESEIWRLPQDANSVMPALRLSYCNLPWEVRQCFAYCAILSKDSRIEKENLIHMWMANGFIPSKEKLEPEDIGNEIWNELYWRSFFQDVENDDFGNIQSFKIHDLVHELAQSIMEDECQHILDVESSINTLSKRTRHVTLVSGYKPFPNPKDLHKVESLRTFRLHYSEIPITNYIEYQFSCDFKKFNSLRVFDARNANITKLSSSIGNLKHLRYLNLSSTRIRTLPESICTLSNLQILNLNYCWALESLPKNLRCLRNLRHLYINRCPLTHMPPKIGQLICLKTLSLFIVGRRRGFHLGELAGLDIGGKLLIKHLERVENLVDLGESNLARKQNLCQLELCWDHNGEPELQKNVEQVLEALQPHPNLKQLVIRQYHGVDFPLWMRDPILKNVTSVVLDNCKNCLHLPPFGQLPFLRHLEICGMNYVKHIDDDESHGAVAVRRFPSLETLKITDLPCLEMLSREEESRDIFPCLSQLSISICPKLSLSCLPSLKDLTVSECNNVLLSSGSDLSCLTSLSILQHLELTSLPDWFGKITSLQSLNIWYCPKIVSLPCCIQSLTNLRTLTISRCPELAMRCEKGSGEDWHKIAHIPKVELFL